MVTFLLLKESVPELEISPTIVSVRPGRCCPRHRGSRTNGEVGDGIGVAAVIAGLGEGAGKSQTWLPK
jgi:hypothetical protein